MEQVFLLIVGAGFGSLATFAIQNYYSLRAQDVAHLNDFIDDISRIETYSVDYWLIEPNTDDGRERDLAVRIRGAINATSTFVDGESKKLLGDDFDEFAELDGRLFDSATGGDFETRGKVRSPERVIEIMRTCNQLRGLVRRARRKTYWFR